MDVWKKLLGITGGVRPATNLQHAIEQPGHPASWKAIQGQAQKNAALYEDAVPFVPRSWTDDSQKIPGSILPNWDGKKLVSYLPCQKEFWLTPQFSPAGAAQLGGCKGLITALPVRWTQGENVQIPFPTALLVQNETPARVLGETKLANSGPIPQPSESAV